MTNKELQAKVVELENRIAGLEAMLKTQDAKTSRINTVESKDSKTKSKKSTEVVIGNLVFSGKYVKTGTGFMSSKTRYAIGQRILELGGTKLAKGNPVFDKCHKADKYVQVYEFKTLADCKKFMIEQEKRVG